MKELEELIQKWCKLEHDRRHRLSYTDHAELIDYVHYATHGSHYIEQPPKDCEWCGFPLPLKRASRAKRHPSCSRQFLMQYTRNYAARLKRERDAARDDAFGMAIG